MDMWQADVTMDGHTYKKGVTIYSPFYVNKGIKLYTDEGPSEILGNVSWDNGLGTIWNMLGLFGNNGTVLGYKSGDSLKNRIVVSEAAHPGTGDHIRSWGNWNFNGSTFHNAAISATYLTVSGSKNCIQTTEHYGERLINAYETAEYYFGDIGFGTINEDGECLINIDDMFAECVNTNIKYHVFTQAYNGSIDTIERYPTYIIVKGTPDTEFSWEIKAKRIGYENHRLEVPEIDRYCDNGLELFSDSDFKVETSEEALDEALLFNLEHMLLEEHV